MMKAIVLTRRRQITELCILCICLIIAFALNVWAIISYDAPWSELYSTFFYVLIFALALYALTVLLRLCFYGIRSVVRHTTKKTSKQTAAEAV